MSVNPYAPPRADNSLVEIDDEVRARFNVTRWQLSDAEGQFLVRKHPILLLAVSFASIVIAAAAVVVAGLFASVLLIPRWCSE